MKNVMYMAVTNDEIELPVVVAETRDEFARLCGHNKDLLSQMASRKHASCRVHGESVKIVRVKLEGDDVEKR